MNLFVTFALLPERAIRQLATLVGHEVAALSEGQVLQVQELSGHHRLQDHMSASVITHISNECRALKKT